MIRIACLLYEGFQLLDVAGPLAVFEVAGHQGGGQYRVETLATVSGPVQSSGATALIATSDLRQAKYDTLFIPGGLGARQPNQIEALLPVIRDAARKGRRIVSVSSAAFILAEAGVLTGQHATTHWGAAALLADRFPDLSVDGQSLYMRQGNIWTSAGSTTGVDLALAIVEQDFGAVAAAAIAKALLLPFRRTGAHAQQSPMLVQSRSSRFNELLAWMQQRLGEDLSIERLADQAALSVRHFTRAFRTATGESVARYVEMLRIDRARGLIESSALSIEGIADQCGFGSAERMRRAFLRAEGRTPREMRRARARKLGPHARARS